MNQLSITIAAEVHERLVATARAQGLDLVEYLERVAISPPALEPHRRELVERLLAWWDGDLSPLACSVKLAVAKLAGMEWVIPEIEAQRVPASKDSDF